MEWLSSALILFLVLDPFGNLPVFQSVLARVPERRRRAVLVRELLIAYGILVAFLLTGDRLMRLLGLEQPTLGIAGGILMFLIGLGMVFPTKSWLAEAPGSEPFIVPLAVPLIAGPSALAVLLLMASRHPGVHLPSLAALTAAWTAGAVILLLAPWVHRILGAKGANAIERLMGLVLIMIAVQMFLDGLEVWTAQCHHP